MGFFLLLYSEQYALQTSSWPTTTGTIVESNVHMVHGGRGSIYFYLEVRYVYPVGEKSFTGEDITSAGTESFASDEEAQKRTNQYRKGSAVKVHYNALAPWQAVLETGPSSGWKQAMGFLALGMAAAALLIWSPRPVPRAYVETAR